MLVPSSGLSKVTFNGVPTTDLATKEVFLEQQLLSKVKCNLICLDLHFILQLCWLCPAQSLTSPFSSISFAFLDPDGTITQVMVQSHLVMFGKAITLKKWQARLPILQCTYCHQLGHQGPCCLLSEDALCCHLCGGNHCTLEHPLKCSKASSHHTPGMCDCPISCLICKKHSHSIRDLSCPT
jgi:hypothetical protein